MDPESEGKKSTSIATELRKIGMLGPSGLGKRGSLRAVVWPTRCWRRRRDSNPRYALTAYNGLANRRLQPLGHVSRAEKSITYVSRPLRTKPEWPPVCRRELISAPHGRVNRPPQPHDTRLLREQMRTHLSVGQTLPAAQSAQPRRACWAPPRCAALTWPNWPSQRRLRGP
jgi:hypothetical protein